MIRLVAAAAAWAMVAGMNLAMLWALVPGGFLEATGDGQGIADEMRILTYAALGAIAAVTMAYETVGLLLVTRPGGGRVGTVLLVGGLLFSAIPFGYVVGGFLVVRQPYDPMASALFLLGPACIALGYAFILPILALVFPHGSLPSPRWRLPVVAVATMLTAATALTIVRPGPIAGETPSRNPFGIDALPATLIQLGELLVGLSVVAVSLLGAAAVVIRYRRGSRVERQQLRWFLAAVLLAAAPIAVSPQQGIGGPAWVLVAALGLLLVPVSVGIAVTRYRLYEIDRLISRTIGYALVTGMLVAVFAGAVLGLQTVLEPLTGENTVAVAASTLLVAALFQPLRRRIQSAVDRRFDRARYDGERTIAAFTARLRDQVDLDSLEGELGSVVRQTVAPATLGLWIQQAGGVE